MSLLNVMKQGDKQQGESYSFRQRFNIQGFFFHWKSKNGKNVKSTGTIITTIHDVEGSNNPNHKLQQMGNSVPTLLWRGVGGGLFSKNIALTLRGNMTKRIYKMISAYKDKTYYEYSIETFRKDFNVSKSYSNYLIGKRY